MNFLIDFFYLIRMIYFLQNILWLEIQFILYQIIALCIYHGLSKFFSEENYSKFTISIQMPCLVLF